MNYIKIFLYSYIIGLIFNTVNTNNFNQKLMNDIFIPLEIEISLDFLKMQINKEAYALKNYWDGQESKNIIKKAEIIVKNSPEKFKDIVKTNIIRLFKKVDIDIIFTQNNLIIKENSSFSVLHNDHSKEEEQIFLNSQSKEKKEYLLKHKNSGYKPTQPKKIKGARKTMKRLKKRYADQKKAEEKHHQDIIEALHEHTKRQLEKKTNEYRTNRPQEKHVADFPHETQEQEINRTFHENILKQKEPIKFNFSHEPEPKANVHTFDIKPELT